MTIRIGHYLPILAIGVLTLPLAACDKDHPFEKALTVLNGGTPVPGGPSVSMYVSPVEDVEVAEVALEPVECHVPPARFRELWCNPDTNILEPIP